MPKNCRYSLKAICTKVSLLHLLKKEHIYLTQLEGEASIDNLHVLYSFLDYISKMFSEILNSCVPVENEKARSQTEDFLYECVIDVQKVKLNKFTKKYCECLVSWCESPDKWSHIDIIFKGIHAILKSSSIHLERVFMDVVSDVIKDYLRQTVDEYQHEYQVPVLDKLLLKTTEIIEGQLLPFIFPRSTCKSSLLPENHVYQLYFDIRMPLLFEIIMEYPDSLVAIQDLGRCVVVLDAGADLCNKLSRAIKERLLHPAVETSNLITAYICIIKSLRVLDPTYVFEEIVTPDIRKTLLKREDTIKGIVDKVLTIGEESEDSIYNDLAQPTPIKIVVQNELTEFGDVKCTFEEMNDWKPDPINSFGVRSLWYKPLDVLSLLLSIYNSRELFASEYKSLLSKRLIKSMNFDVEKELKNLETLKSRFGPHNLQDCDVMLKDIRESKRITNTIKEKILESNIDINFNIQPYIISSNYWPKMTDKEFRLPDQLKVPFDMYSRLYSDYKRNRELKWYQMLGSVDIEVELNNKHLRMEVTSLQASVIHYFSETARWELHELSKVLVTNVSRVRSAINFWIQKEFLKSVTEFGIPETYALVELNDIESSNNRKKVIDIECTGDSEEENGEVSVKKEAKLYEDLWMIVSFILRRASDQKMAMDIDKIFTTIPIYTTDDPINVTKDQLEIFLDNKVSHKLLTVTQKNYYLNKK